MVTKFHINDLVVAWRSPIPPGIAQDQIEGRVIDIRRYNGCFEDFFEYRILAIDPSRYPLPFWILEDYVVKAPE